MRGRTTACGECTADLQKRKKPGRFLRDGLLPAVWSELARPAALAAIEGRVPPSEECRCFWEKATLVLQEAAIDQAVLSVNFREPNDKLCNF